LVRIGTVAVVVGLFDGIWILAVQYLGRLGASVMVNDWGPLTLALAVVLIVDSFFSMVGPRKAFYVTAVIALLVAGSIFSVVGTGYELVADLTVILTLALFVLALVAARREPKVSEQSHPMNLPVFG
jgi:hypothetical protein